MKRIAAILFLAAELAARAQTTNNVREMTLQDCFTEALKHNFDVQVERYAPEISLYDLHAAYAGYDPQFTLSGGHTYNQSGLDGFPSLTTKGDNYKSGLSGELPWGMTYDLSGDIGKSYGSYLGTNFNRGASGSAGVTVTQPLLKNFWIHGNRLAITAAKNNLKASEQSLRAQIITTITAVETAFYNLVYARESVKVQQEALALAEQQFTDDKARVDIGTIAQSGGTLEQDEALVAQNRATLINAYYTLTGAQNTLKNLITDNYSKSHDTDIAPVGGTNAEKQLLDLQDSWNKGMTQRPDLIQAKISVEQQGIQLKYDKNQIWPELDLVGSYGFNGEGSDFSGTYNQVGEVNRPFYSYGAQLSVPLSNAKARNGYKADRAVQQQLLLKLKQLEQNVMVQIDDAVAQARSAWDSIEATRQGRIAAEAALHAEQEKYKVGKSTTFTVLQLQKSLTDARTAEIQAVANYNIALANLAAQEGSTLERRQIDFKVK
jgi:outer membrane protein